jgi:hypothetical protein
MIRSSQINIIPMDPKEFVALYGKKFAARVSGYPVETLGKYLAKPESKRYINPSDSVKLHFGAIHQIIITNSNPQES